MAGRKTQDISIYDETSDSNALVDTNGDLHTTSKITDGTDTVDIIDDAGTKRLAVNAAVTINFRSSQVINEYDGFSTNRNKAGYTVPAGKVLFIQNVYCSLGDDGGTIGIELQDNSNGVASFGISDSANSHATTTFSSSSPLGPFGAGRSIRLRRAKGDSDKDWAAGWTGYLEDT